jgi:alkylated DNA repair protein alkB homolog 1
VGGYQVAVLPYPEGSILVKNFNSPQIVHHIAEQALNTYWKKPYRTNLDSREELYK